MSQEKTNRWILAIFLPNPQARRKERSHEAERDCLFLTFSLLLGQLSRLFESLFGIFTLSILVNRPLFTANREGKSTRKYLSTKLGIKTKQVSRKIQKVSETWVFEFISFWVFKFVNECFRFQHHVSKPQGLPYIMLQNFCTETWREIKKN